MCKVSPAPQGIQGVGQERASHAHARRRRRRRRTAAAASRLQRQQRHEVAHGRTPRGNVLPQQAVLNKDNHGAIDTWSDVRWCKCSNGGGGHWSPFSPSFAVHPRRPARSHRARRQRVQGGRHEDGQLAQAHALQLGNGGPERGAVAGEGRARGIHGARRCIEGEGRGGRNAWGQARSHSMAGGPLGING